MPTMPVALSSSYLTLEPRLISTTAIICDAHKLIVNQAVSQKKRRHSETV